MMSVKSSEMIEKQKTSLHTSTAIAPPSLGFGIFHRVSRRLEYRLHTPVLNLLLSLLDIFLFLWYVEIC